MERVSEMIQKVFTASTLLQIFEAIIAANKRPTENTEKYPVHKPKIDIFTETKTTSNLGGKGGDHGLTKDMMMIIQSPSSLH